jgi:hypothetical protein
LLILTRSPYERVDGAIRTSRDVNAFDNRGYLDMQFAKKWLYRTYWQWRAAKDLEAAVQINPREFYAWHNYGDLNSNAGDLGMMNDYSNARRAVTAYQSPVRSAGADRPRQFKSRACDHRNRLASSSPWTSSDDRPG